MLSSALRPLIVPALCLIAATAQAEPAVVILVRHAERAVAPADDPPLTSAGEKRALDLADALGDTKIDAIIATQFLRTRHTAAPIAAARKLEPIIVKAGGDTATHVDAVVAAVRRHRPGEAVLVVGHSNTIPAIIGALGGPKMPQLCDSAYANLFVLVLGNTPARLIRAQYGSPDPPQAADCHRQMR